MSVKLQRQAERKVSVSVDHTCSAWRAGDAGPVVRECMSCEAAAVLWRFLRQNPLRDCRRSSLSTRLTASHSRAGS